MHSQPCVVHRKPGGFEKCAVELLVVLFGFPLSGLKRWTLGSSDLVRVVLTEKNCLGSLAKYEYVGKVSAVKMITLIACTEV